jgi:hypothetical protein
VGPAALLALKATVAASIAATSFVIV